MKHSYLFLVPIIALFSCGKSDNQNNSFVDSITPSQNESMGVTKNSKPSLICPEEDYYHRYIDVPLSYSDPSLGSFKLYYEINSGFDSGKPTLMYTQDGQTISHIGDWVDQYKKEMGISFNVVTYDIRGQSCSKIDSIWIDQKVNWKKAYDYLHSDNVIQDMEKIRIDLLGDDTQMYIIGESGPAMLSLKYLSKYPKSVSKAMLGSVVKDSRTLDIGSNLYFKRFLLKNRLFQSFLDVIEGEFVPPRQFIFLVQRALYFNQEKAKDLILKTKDYDLSIYNDQFEKHGNVEEFISTFGDNFPNLAVWLYETLGTHDSGIGIIPDVNFPFKEMAHPLGELAEAGEIIPRYVDIKGLKNISSEITLFSGTLDHVTLTEGTIAIHRQLTHSKMAIFKDYHAMKDGQACYQILVSTFYEFGNQAPEFDIALRSPQCSERLLQILN